MRAKLLLGAACLCGFSWACGGSSSPSAFNASPTPDGGAAGDDDDDGSVANPGDDGGTLTGIGDASGNSSHDAAQDGTVVVTTTIYAHTDDTLYSVDPSTKAITLVGKFAGIGGGTGDSSITDLAVNEAGEVYVNSETVVYKAALPAGGTGAVQLTKVATITNAKSQKFFALGFTPKDALGPGTGEVLVGGDGAGELWSINPTSGATKDLGGFGDDPSISGNVLALSGDVMFYVDASGAPTGLATIRSCTPSKSGGSPSCSRPSDYLAGIDMTALKTAFTSGTPAASLNGGIYGGSSTTTGAGTGHKDVFGLGAWEGNVYGFTRMVSGSAAQLLLIETSGANAGQGSVVPTQVSVTNGWSGAGVTTKVTVTVPPPPPPPPPPH